MLELTISTPLQIALHEAAVASVRAEDASGDFGIQSGHADFLTVIGAGVLRWRRAEGPWHYAALRGGVMTVTGGTAVAIACREAIFSDNLPDLQAQIAQLRLRQDQDARQARTQDAKLHARAIRRLSRQLRMGADTLGLEDTP